MNNLMNNLMKAFNVAAAAWALCALPVLGQQTNNNALHAVPTPGKVVIDGKLDDWDLSGRIDVFASLKTRGSYSTKVAAMYDADHFYLAVEWRDPTPMHNMVDSNFDIGSGWKSDCLQLRLKTDMVVGSVDCWYSTAARHPVINIQHGRFTGGRDKETDTSAFEPVNDALKVGAQQAFAPGEDGKSYTQEIALPWKLITGQAATVKATGKPFKEPKRFGPGDSFNMGMEFLWGPPDGRTFPIHRYADLLMPGKSSREFFWTAEDAWGPVILEPKGNLKLARDDYAASAEYLQQTQGPVEFTYTMPFDGFATLVVEDERGRRVKNLIGMAPRSKGRQTDRWDGTDDAGKLMPPGTYSIRGLLHAGIDPVYEASYGSPGVPPWETADGRGGWMSDHNPNVAVAAGKEMMLLAASGCEGGRALIGTDLSGRRKWGESKFQGIAAVAADDRFAYAAMNGGHQWGTKDPSIGRVMLADGKYAPFATKPEPQLTVPVATAEEKATVRGLAVVGDRLAVALAGPDVVRFFDKASMQAEGEIKVSAPGGLACDTRGRLLAVSGRSVVMIADGKIAPLVTANLDKPTGLAIDAAGKIYVADRGTHQVKVFTSAGAFDHAVGVAGGRPLPGKWVAGGMRDPAGIAIDPQGRLWVAEETMYPKRFSVWAADGTLATDFIGPPTYGGMGACVDPDDKTRVFGNGCEMKLDYAANNATVTANLLDDDIHGELLKIDGREYFMTKRGRLYQRRGDALVLVASIGSGPPSWKPMMESLRQLGLEGMAQGDPNQLISWMWSDANDDGKGQPEEATVVQGPVLGLGYWGGYWLDEQFNIYTAGPEVRKVPLARWTSAGTPVWDLKQIRTVGKAGDNPIKLFLATDGKVICGTPLTCLADDGTKLWSYGLDLYTDVHGSHLAPIPDRDDRLYGVLSCIGTADTPVGKAFAMNSNMGRLSCMTTDGLLVAAVFQDCRIGPEAWPDDPKAGAPLGGTTMGGEWFGGYFFKAKATNEYYLVAGGYSLIKLNGFDTLQAIPTATVTLTPEGLVAAEKLLQQRALAAAAANELAIARLPAPAAVDGKLDKYPKESLVSWKAGNATARAAVATDGTSLLVAYDVTGDANPMVNGGKDVTQLFTTGDSVDLQIGTDPAADPKRADAVPGDLRLLISVLDGKPAAVVYRWKTAGTKRPQTFTCPWRQYTVEDVQVLGDATVKIDRRNGGYTLEAAVPLATLGFDPKPETRYKLDLGVIFSDSNGTNRAQRMYWANKATGLVSDVPGEIMPTPTLWGSATLAGGGGK